MRPLYEDGEANQLRVDFGYEILAIFDIAAILQSLPKLNGITKCSEKWKKTDCLAQCYYKETKNLCNCSSPMVPKLSSALAVSASFNYDVRVLFL